VEHYKLVATAAFGLESVVARELKNLGFDDVLVENGRLSYAGRERDIARSNIWLRTADRVMIEMARFRAADFEELFQGVLSVPWEEIIPFSGTIHVRGRSSQSKLSSVPSCQAVVKKAIIESLKRKHPVGTFPETGPRFAVEVSILKDMATICLDTTGAGLHKRGYRKGSGEAALKETLSAGLVYLSRWRPPGVLADPFCGSGTIAIEAALITRNIAPGMMRRFAAEEWPFIEARVWEEARSEARSLMNKEKVRIIASDADDKVLLRARQNARHAGVSSCIEFRKGDFRELKPQEAGGTVICNPPYGERLGDKRSISELCKDMGRAFQGFDGWSFFIFTGFEEFEKYYGKRADGNRKLYNARIKCYLYEYSGKSKRKYESQRVGN